MRKVSYNAPKCKNRCPAKLIAVYERADNREMATKLPNAIYGCAILI